MLNMAVMKTVDFLQVTLHAIYWCRYFVIIYTHLTLAGLGVNMFG